jgi:NAD(P)-dependent dehydrogenase (short-subunit alcohol dehydrogenase family)
MKHYVIVGGTSGIGLELVNILKENNRLTLLSRSEFTKSNPNIEHITFDVLSDEIPISKLPEKIDGFVYCPGTVNLKPFKMLNPDAFKEDLDLNFLGLIRVLQPIMDHFNPGSSLVFYSSVAVAKGMPFHTSVSASKAAIEGFTRSLAAEYAPRIRVNAIAPSLVDTPLVARMLNHEKKQENMNARHPLGRYGRPQDIAQMTAFLLSEQSSWMTGQVIGVDGGVSALQNS